MKRTDRIIISIIATRKDIALPIVCAHFNMFAIIFISMANDVSNYHYFLLNFLLIMNLISGLWLFRVVYNRIKTEYRLQKVEKIVIGMKMNRDNIYLIGFMIAGPLNLCLAVLGLLYFTIDYRYFFVGLNISCALLSFSRIYSIMKSKKKIK